MSKKMQLPDEMLDLVAGGKIAIEGEIVQDLKSDLEGVTATTPKGTYSFKWNKDPFGDGSPFSEEMREKWLPGMHEEEEVYDMTAMFKS